MGSLEEFLSSYSPNVQDLVKQARTLIQYLLPGALEIIDLKSKIIAYGYSTKYKDLLCAIAPYRNYANLIFSKGAALPDPEKLLLGTGKQARHLKIKNLSDLDNPAYTILIQQANHEIKPSSRKTKQANTI